MKLQPDRKNGEPLAKLFGFLSLLLAFQLSATNLPDFRNYQLLKCSGSIQPYLQPVHRNLGSASLLTRKIFNNYDLMYGDTLSSYIHILAHRILSKVDMQRPAPACLVVRSPHAFVDISNEGYLFISTGMITQAENESQLAFLLAHYLAHWEFFHVRSDGRNLASWYNSSLMNHLKPDTRLQCQTFYNNQEQDADLRAIELYARAGFETKGKAPWAILMAPAGNRGFSWSTEAISNPDSKLPLALNLNDSNLKHQGRGPFSLEDPGETCHYLSEERLEMLSRKMRPSDALSFHVLPENDFAQVRRIAEYETILSMLHEGFALEALYAASAIRKRDGESPFVRKLQADALYVLSLRKTAEAASKPDKATQAERNTLWQRQKGEVKKLYYFYNRISGAELIAIAASAMYQLHELDSNHLTHERVKDLFRVMANDYKISQYEFKTAVEDSLTAEGDGSTYQLKVRKTDLKYFNYLFYRVRQPDKFRDLYYFQKQTSQKTVSDTGLRQLQVQVEKINDKYGKVFGLDSVYISDIDVFDVVPAYYFTDSGIEMRLIRADFRKLDLYEKAKESLLTVQQLGQEAKLLATIPDTALSFGNLTELVNLAQGLRRWQNERMAYHGLNYHSFTIQYLDKQKIPSAVLRVRMIRNTNQVTLLVQVFNPVTDQLLLTQSETFVKAGLNSKRVQMYLYSILDHIKQRPLKIQNIQNDYEARK